MSFPKPTSQYPLDKQFEQIDQVLHALRDAEPAFGKDAMQQRILRHLAAVSPSRPSHPFTFFFMTPRSACAFAASLAAAMAAAVFFFHHPAIPASISPRILAANTSRRGIRQPTLCPMNGAPCKEWFRPESKQRTKHAAPLLLPTESLPQLQLGATLLPSFPAPPLPLTLQEQLLLRLASRGDRKQFATLTPDSKDSVTDVADLNPLQAPPLPHSPAIDWFAAALINFKEPTPSSADFSDVQAAEPQSTSTQSNSGDPSWQPVTK